MDSSSNWPQSEIIELAMVYHVPRASNRKGNGPVERVSIGEGVNV